MLVSHTYICSIRLSGVAGCWTPRDVREVVSWIGHYESVRSLEIIDRPRAVVTSSYDMSVRVWSWNGTCLGNICNSEVETEIDPLLGADRRFETPWLFRVDTAHREQARAAKVGSVVRQLKERDCKARASKNQSSKHKFGSQKAWGVNDLTGNFTGSIQPVRSSTPRTAHQRDLRSAALQQARPAAPKSSNDYDIIASDSEATPKEREDALRADLEALDSQSPDRFSEPINRTANRDRRQKQKEWDRKVLYSHFSEETSKKMGGQTGIMNRVIDTSPSLFLVDSFPSMFSASAPLLRAENQV